MNPGASVEVIAVKDVNGRLEVAWPQHFYQIRDIARATRVDEYLMGKYGGYGILPMCAGYMVPADELEALQKMIFAEGTDDHANT